MRELEADYVIIGAGSAGCVLANRLSASGDRRVILVEAGPSPWHPLIRIPAGCIYLYDNSSITWRYRTQPESGANGRELIFPAGKGLGGSTNINGLLYVRPLPADIDAWQEQGAEGWTFQSCLPFFKKSETWSLGVGPQRGAEGPLHIGRIRDVPEICSFAVDAGRQLGLEYLEDYNADTRGPSVWYYQQTIEKGRRCSAASSFLKGARGRKNLTVVKGLAATRIILDGAIATGVECVSNSGERVLVRASTEVIVSAGVIGSPKLLELSGIGNSAVLESAGVKPVVDLPGVGEGLQDHYVARLSFRVRGTVTANERAQGLRLVREIARYFLSGDGLLSYSAALVGAFATTRLSDQPDVQYVVAPGSFAGGRAGRLEAPPGISCGVWQMRPESRGGVHIASSDHTKPPKISVNYLNSTLDRQTLVEGMRIARRWFAQPALRPYIEHETLPGAGAESDAALLEYARSNGNTTYHGVGTCRMGADDLSVVDSELRVRGVQRLRVIDASVMPTITSTNTNATVLMVAERAAEKMLAAGANSATPALGMPLEQPESATATARLI